MKTKYCIRNGSWNDTTKVYLTALHFRLNPDDRLNLMGLRLIVTIVKTYGD